MSKFSAFIAILFITFSHSVIAWDGTESGKVAVLQVTHESNFAFRVTLDTLKPMCGSDTHTWAYLNKSDSNYETYVSALLAAKFAQTPVTVHTNKDASGYCKIGYIALH